MTNSLLPENGSVIECEIRHALNIFDPDQIGDEWFHNLLLHNQSDPLIPKDELRSFAYFYFIKFLPFFRNQIEGSIEKGISIEVSKRMKSKLGLAYMFEQKIILNEEYFSQYPQLLPYTLFHEMTHLWLYSCCWTLAILSVFTIK